MNKQGYERAGLAAFIGVVMLGMADCEGAELDLRWTVNIGSKHVGTDVDYNEVNPGLGFEARTVEYPTLYATGGTYYNSEYSASMYGGMGWEGLSLAGGALKVGAEAGLVTGYKAAFIQPVVAGTVRVADHVKVLVIPPVGVSPLTFGLQVVF